MAINQLTCLWIALILLKKSFIYIHLYSTQNKFKLSLGSIIKWKILIRK